MTKHEGDNTIVLGASTETQQFAAAVDAIANEEITAYAAYKKMFEAGKPAPVLERPTHGDTVAGLALAVLVIASVVVSGSRTVPEFGGGVIGVAAFIMLELGVIVYAFLYTRSSYTTERHANVRRLFGMGMWFALVIVVAANLHYVIKGDGEASSVQWFETLVNVMLAVSAPVLAYIAGEAFAMLAVARAKRLKDAEQIYEQELEQWNAALRSEWDTKRSAVLTRVRKRSVSVRTEQPEQLPNRTPNSQNVLSVRSEQPEQNTEQNGEHYFVLNEQSEHARTEQNRTQRTARTRPNKKRTPSGVLIREWLEQNPNSAELNSREIAAAILADTGQEVSHSTVYAQMKRSEQE